MAAEVLSLLRAALRDPGAATLKALASKALGLGVVAGSAVLKIPQIVAIARAGNAKGLSREMFEAETVGYTIMLASSLQHGLSFSDYGEQAFVLAQNLVLLVLLYRFVPPPLLRTSLLWGAYVALVAAFLSGSLEERFLEWAVSANSGIFLYARVPQILTNARTKSTGALSGTTTFLQLAGGAVRILTTVQAGGSRAMVAGYILGALLNGVLFAQILLYGGSKAARKTKPTRRITRAKLA